MHSLRVQLLSEAGSLLIYLISMNTDTSLSERAFCQANAIQRGRFKGPAACQIHIHALLLTQRASLGENLE